jgi:hypothetical protein
LAVVGVIHSALGDAVGRVDGQVNTQIFSRAVWSVARLAEPVYMERVVALITAHEPLTVVPIIQSALGEAVAQSDGCILTQIFACAIGSTARFTEPAAVERVIALITAHEPLAVVAVLHSALGDAVARTDGCIYTQILACAIECQWTGSAARLTVPIAEQVVVCNIVAHVICVIFGVIFGALGNTVGRRECHELSQILPGTIGSAARFAVPRAVKCVISNITAHESNSIMRIIHGALGYAVVGADGVVDLKVFSNTIWSIGRLAIPKSVQVAVPLAIAYEPLVTQPLVIHIALR